MFFLVNFFKIYCEYAYENNYLECVHIIISLKYNIGWVLTFMVSCHHEL
jgi:hypothetical protein